MSERAERSDARRNMERVLQAAQELFAERGPDVPICEVAARAGVGVGTIYRRFPNKAQLFAAVSGAACHDTQRCLAQAADEAADPVEQLRALVLVQWRQSLQQAALLDMPGVAEGPFADRAGFYATLHALLARAIAAGQRQGRLRPGDPDALAAISMELLSPRAVQRLRQSVGDGEAAAAQVAEFVLAGLAAPR
jgi:AcrR family transcriptional regulator